ncbi:MAG TPA: alpha/beta fold hydrolase, partial [Hyphomicrobiales bacterium]|nr:alpha/beta fold hydrolase [Hyphomicrobiales bacterium]
MAEQINPAGASTPGATYVRIPLSLTASGPAEGQPDADLSSLTFLHEAVCAALRFWAPFLRFAGGDKEGVTQRLPARLEGQASRTEVARSVDRLLHANMGRFTLGLSPYALWLAYADWAIHLSASPGKWQQLAEKSLQEQVRFLVYMLSLAADPASPPCIEPMPEDQRFQNEAWRRLPFNLISQAFLLTEQWWRNATTGISGVSLHHQQVVAFMARQLLDALAPTNFIALNPEVIEATLHEGGQNLVRGFANFWEDFERAINDEPPPGAEKFRPGQTVAITRGKVVHRNRLIELIQYAPATKEVQKEPVLIIPAWIMKYYILDLSPENSLVKYLVDHGHTVFMVSWHNPGAEDRDLGMDDYLRFGVLDALEAVRAIVPDIKVNAVGYCLGGTLLSIAAAYLAQRNETFLNSISMFAAQTDFTEAGELTLFVDESQISYLEDIMWEQGYLDSRHMAGTFQLLRSSDLIWSRITR